MGEEWLEVNMCGSMSVEPVLLNCFKLLCMAFLTAIQIYGSGVQCLM